MSEETTKRAPDRGGRFAGVLALLIALVISLPASAQMMPPAGPQTMQGRGTMMMPNANPMMMPNTNPMPNNGGMNGNMNGGMNGNMGGRNPNMPDDYTMRRMQGPGAPAAPSSGRGTTPSFVGMTRSQASALAQQYGLVPAFDGAESADAVVASQAPEAGVLIFRTAMPIRFQMQVRGAPSQTAAPETPAPVSPAASPATPAPAAPAQATPAAAPAAPPPATPAAAARPAPARAITPPPVQPAAPSHNWWILLAIAAGLGGALWALFGRRKPAPVAHSFNTPEAGGTAWLSTQIVGNGLAEASVSVAAAPAPRFEFRYVVEHSEQPDGIVISLSGGGYGG